MGRISKNGEFITMKICYLWIKKFKGLENFGINLSSEYTYEYDHAKNELTRKAKVSIPDDLYEKHIADISGILGTNGAGKTTLLEFICLALKGKGELISDFFVVFEQMGTCFYRSSSAIFDEIKPKFSITRNLGDNPFETLDVIFFSNVYDGSPLDLGYDVQDISLNNKIEPRRETYSNQYEKAFLQELQFIKSDEFSLLEYETPKKTTVRLSRDFWEKYDHLRSSKDVKDPITNMRDIFLLNENSEGINQVVLLMQFTILTKLYSDYIDDNGSEVIKIFNSKLGKDLISPPDMNDVIAKIIKVLEKGDVSGFSYKDRHFKNLLSKLLVVEDMLKKANFEMASQSRYLHLQFNLTFKRRQVEIFERLAEVISRMPASRINWDQVSSGQKAYLNLFSSIWNALRKQKNVDKLICIDEGDLYLHPKWQLEFVQKLTKILPQLATGEVQIIITTHSPLLVTDLPGQCLSILKKNKEGKIIATSGIQTFGANIYDIYRDSFGIETQKTGNLSQEYINDIIEILDKSEISAAEFKTLQNSQSIIGDKLLSYHITKRIDKESGSKKAGGPQND